MSTYVSQSTFGLDPPEILTKAIANNIIGELQEFCVKNKLKPEYSDAVHSPGANNTNIFRVTCTVGDTRNFGTANTKMNAKKIAALKVLEEIRMALVSTKGTGADSSENASEPGAGKNILDLTNEDEKVHDVTHVVTRLKQTAINPVIPVQVQFPSTTEKEHMPFLNNMDIYVIESTSFRAEFPLLQTTLESGFQLDPPEILSMAVSNNIIGELHEFCVKNKMTNPEYLDEAQWVGANNTNVFRVKCTVGDTNNFGTANKKMNAKKIAAWKVLEKIRMTTLLPESHSVGSNQPINVAETIKVTPKLMYYPDRHIGKGGTSNVYEGYFETPTRKAAVKICSKVNTYHEKNKELDILRKITDPNVVTYYTTEDIGSFTYIVMELASSTLEDVINANTNLDETLFKKWATETTKGLAVLHNFRIIHRDLKPSNILIFPGNIAKLADFGISKELDSCTQGVFTEAARGTRIWMPTEGPKAIGSSAQFALKPSFDIFSLGLTIFYIMTGGMHLFSSDGEGHLQIQANIVSYRPNWEWLVDNKWTALRNLLQSMIHSDPTKRIMAPLALEHPFYWVDKKGLEFVLAVVNDSKNIHPTDCRSELASMYTRICNKTKLSPNWKSRLCTEVQAFIKFKDEMKEQKGFSLKTKKYNELSFLKLLEFIRDYYQHYEDWNDFNDGILKNDAVFGKDETNYMSYFLKSYPELTTILYTFFQESKYHGLQVPDFYKLNTTKSFSMF